MNIYAIFGIVGSIFYSFMLFPLVIQSIVFEQSDAHMGHLLLQLLANICFLIYSVGVFKYTSLENTIPMFIANPLSILSIIYLMRIRYRNLTNPKIEEIRIGCPQT